MATLLGKLMATISPVMCTSQRIVFIAAADHTLAPEIRLVYSGNARGLTSGRLHLLKYPEYTMYPTEKNYLSL